MNTAIVEIVGCACRLPGAPDIFEFWRLLTRGDCAIGPLPHGRWRPEQFFHPRRGIPGFSYSFAGGYLDDPFHFDPGAFGISPREAAQMDPQQRLLLEVAAVALDDAGIPPSSLSGREVGVYVGASSLDHGNSFVADMAAIDKHFMTGNTLSILANRISHVFNLRGPSFVIDTACSSSLIALHEAAVAIAEGRIDVAIVAGVNLLLSPAPFIGFCAASMLSPTGSCRPFSAQADGYVRAEGAVAMVLAREDVAAARGWTARAAIAASGINGDGRTSGIALPSLEGQTHLLRAVYRQAGVDPRQLAFIEAHGTGTLVGDPVEARAIGAALSPERSTPLPIGSVKSNIGHLEPVSGLAGALKAILALQNRRLPKTLHIDEPNPHIDFETLNLVPATEAIDLTEDDEPLLAGVSSFGFGGANAHVVLRSTSEAKAPIERNRAAARFLMLSARSSEALATTAHDFAEAIREGAAPSALAAAVVWRRDASPIRLVTPLGDIASHDIARGLASFAAGDRAEGVERGVAQASAKAIAFVFSGNGGQWAGMGRDAYAANLAFKSCFDEIDAHFHPLAGLSLARLLHEEELEARLALCSVAQPLLFALQTALVAALREWGIRPSVVFGHSFGEIAAAHVAGVLDLAAAVRLIYLRSEAQERARGLGGMAVVARGEDEVRDMLAAHDLQLVIAAVNGPTSVTISGARAALDAFKAEAGRRRVPMRAMDIDYPYHSALLDPLREQLIDALDWLKPADDAIPFVSSVTGARIEGSALDAGYWWRNVREPVLFHAATIAAAREGAGLFVELSPRPLLTAACADSLRAIGASASAISTLTTEPVTGRDPIEACVARILAHGGEGNRERLHGVAPEGRVRLPALPWRRKELRFAPTAEALGLNGDAPVHPLLGLRMMQGAPEWRNLLDAERLPYLRDHKVDGEIVVPGSALVEIALVAARELFPGAAIGLSDFDLVQWLSLETGASRETSVRFSSESSLIEIWSRPRFGPNEWTLHARGVIRRGFGSADVRPMAIDDRVVLEAEPIYRRAEECGLFYGPAFRRVYSYAHTADGLRARLLPPNGDEGAFRAAYVLHPISLDAAFQPLLAMEEPQARTAFLPVRFGDLRVYRPGVTPCSCHIIEERRTRETLSVTIALHGEDDTLVALLRGALFRRMTFVAPVEPEAFFYERMELLEPPVEFSAVPALRTVVAEFETRTPPDSWLFLRAFAHALTHEIFQPLLDGENASVADLVAQKKIAESARAFVAAQLEHLLAAGIACESDAGWSLPGDSGLPPARDVLAAFADEAPEASVELGLAAFALANAEKFVKGAAPAIRSKGLREQFERASIYFQPILDCIRSWCAALARLVEPEPLRILIAAPRCAGLVSTLLPLTSSGLTRLTVFDIDGASLDALIPRLGPPSGVDFIRGDRQRSDDISYHVAIIIAFDDGRALEPAFLAAMMELMAPNGTLVVAQPPSEPPLDLLLGMTPEWFAGAGVADFPANVWATASRMEHALAVAGGGGVARLDLGQGLGAFTFCAPARLAPPAAEWLQIAVTGLDQPNEALAAALAAHGVATAPIEKGRTARHQIYWVHHSRAESATLARHLTRLAALLEGAPEGARLTLALCGGDGAFSADAGAQNEALRRFMRVAANEYSHIDVDTLEFSPELTLFEIAAGLANHIRSPRREPEIRIDAAGRRAPRARPGPPPRSNVDLAASAELVNIGRGSLSKFEWLARERTAPSSDEIEIEIDAAALNFRDVMLTLGLLNDDVLNGGLAGEAMGFECAGRVTAVGPQASRFCVGDMVMGFARHGFSTFVTAAERLFAPIPRGVTSKAAATLPVAFLTAWYALEHLARLKPGEWILIHGAAGGVGLAAMQIARARGARIVATVGTDEKRALVTFFGAEKIYDSRSLDFADQIVNEIGGVDVVLNSLSGDAMRSSLRCLTPFGRFVELGKRDFVANSSLQLRPFRRNLTYFGVDVDLLLAENQDFARQMLDELTERFDSGAFGPLPYTLFPPEDATSAFRLMQAAGHCGKILIDPLPAATIPVAERRNFDIGAGPHLVVGGTSGFGFETALWLAEHGGRKIIVASRRGTLDPDQRQRVERARENGVDFRVEQVDVSSLAQVEALLARIAPLGPLQSVFHCAMHLDDQLIRAMTAERAERVLAPKIDGARNLDLATRGLPIERFVLYSSATTMIGNPGQAAYVAANGYLEGLTRRRRSEGLPALAIGWGAISDVGVLTRQRDLTDNLERVIGSGGMSARRALDHLAHLLTRNGDEPVVYCAQIHLTSTLRGLKMLSSPPLSGLFGESREIAADFVDLREMLANKSADEAREIVTDLLAAELGRILRLSAEEIDANRPLAELGMDSLMSVEMHMRLETRMGVDLPIIAITNVRTLRELSDSVIARLGANGVDDEEQENFVLRWAARRHGLEEPRADMAGLVRDAQAVVMSGDLL